MVRGKLWNNFILSRNLISSVLYVMCMDFYLGSNGKLLGCLIRGVIC